MPEQPSAREPGTPASSERDQEPEQPSAREPGTPASSERDQEPEQPSARAARLAMLGHRGELGPTELAELETAVSEDPDPRCRAAALGALIRAAPGSRAYRVWLAATGDSSPAVRRRGADAAPDLATRADVDAGAVVHRVAGVLGDPEVMVVVTAAWALGELAGTAPESERVAAVTSLAAVTTEHPDALAREAAVAALGAIGDRRALPAILTACRDKPTVRRRAVLALAPFTGDDVTAALEAALTDRDWQVRQGAEDLLGPEPSRPPTQEP